MSIADVEKAIDEAIFIPKSGGKDPDGYNIDRVAWAAVALAAFQKATGTDDEDAVADLLCDLMHFCAGHADFARELRRACGNFEAETGEGGW